MTKEKDFTLEELEDQLRILIDEKYETGNIDSSIEIQEEIESLRRRIADLRAKK